MGVGVDVMSRRRGCGGCRAAPRQKCARGENEHEGCEERGTKKKESEKFPGPAVAGFNTVPHTSGSLGAVSVRRLSVCLSEAGVDGGGQQLNSPTQRTRSLICPPFPVFLAPAQRNAGQAEPQRSAAVQIWGK